MQVWTILSTKHSKLLNYLHIQSAKYEKLAHFMLDCRHILKKLRKPYIQDCCKIDFIYPNIPYYHQYRLIPSRTRPQRLCLCTILQIVALVQYYNCLLLQDNHDIMTQSTTSSVMDMGANAGTNSNVNPSRSNSLEAASNSTPSNSSRKFFSGVF